jgi:glycosidase
LLTAKTSPFIFQGDEIGMTNLTLSKVSESKDIETHAGWQQCQKEGKSEADFLKIANLTGRDNARTPMQWNSSHEAGFTSGKPWMMINPNHTEINVERQESDPESVLNFFRQMVAVKKSNPVLTYGKFEIVESGESSLFMYHRIFDEEKWLVILNFSSNAVPFPFESGYKMERVIGNYDTLETGFIRPWEALVYKV